MTDDKITFLHFIQTYAVVPSLDAFRVYTFHNGTKNAFIPGSLTLCTHRKAEKKRNEESSVFENMFPPDVLFMYAGAASVASTPATRCHIDDDRRVNGRPSALCLIFTAGRMDRLAMMV